MTEREHRAAEFLWEKLHEGESLQSRPEELTYRWEHSLRVAQIGKEIARAEGLDDEAMGIACLLHDVSYGTDVPEGYDWREHGRDSARIARPFLKELGLPVTVVEDICYGIAIHVDDRADFPGRRTPFTETVGDADNIDRFDVYRIYDTLRYRQFDRLPLGERLTWLEGLLPQLERLQGMCLATRTAEKLWRDRLAYQIGFYCRLMEQMKNSCLLDEMEEAQ